MNRLPPLLERSPLDDVKWLVAMLTGVAIGWVLFDADDGLLVSFAITGVALVIVLNVVRRVLRAVRGEH